MSVATPSHTRVRVAVAGAVQGVGFRPFVYRLAHELRLHGFVSNGAAGVAIEAEGPTSDVRRFLARLETDKPTIALIQSLETSFLAPVGYGDFQIRASTGGDKRTLVLPDLATCPACVHEIFDPSNRRYLYPFTNCTDCGPRFSIIRSLPYDRAATTMSDFVMCERCAHEYEDPGDRRFHAQPNACPACGPQLSWWDAKGSSIAQRHEALTAAVRAIRDGYVVAVKGVGGFHLMVDARNENAVRALRERKHREEKPLALLMPSFEVALRYCNASEVERRILRAPECPIVLLPRHGTADLAPSIAPGSPTLGIMLPGNPLHHLLLHELAGPVVATSGNLSEEPLCTDENEAVARLAGIADFFLVHDRPILRHVDDSIVREMVGREMVLRRARGFAPLPISVEGDLPPILALGGHQKNTVAIAVGSHVFISQHIGDLETVESQRAFESVTKAMQDLYDFRPQTIACDIHPDYKSTQYAERAGIPLEKVQHHEAHVLACMAENHLQPPALGVAWDGSGMGTDDTVWGGELFHVTENDVRRVAHLRPFRLPGNAKAVREPRRAALAVLYEVFGNAVVGVDAPTLRAFAPSELDALVTMLGRQINAPWTTSAGRLFDAIASLLDVRQIASFEGQAAMALEHAVDRRKQDRPYPYAIVPCGGLLLLDWEPAVRALLAEPTTAAIASARFHAMLVEMVTDVASRIGERNVILSGGCFQNRVLTEGMVCRLAQAGYRPFWHQRVPPNDGGLALGQILAARRRAFGRKD